MLNKDRRPLQIIKDLFDYYKEREDKLIRLLYEKGADGYEIANAIEVHPSLISKYYPKFPKEAK